jgi:two-component system NtrC family sensor kinase
VIAHIWKEAGEEKAIQFIDDASKSGSLDIHWVWPHILLEKNDLSAEQRKLLHKVLEGRSVSYASVTEQGASLWHTLVPVDTGLHGRGALDLSQPLLPFKEFYRKMLTRAVTITALLALGCGIILYLFMDKKIRVPLNRLTAHAQRIGQGDLSLDNVGQENNELAEMAHAMNDMCSRLLIAREKIKFEYNARLNTLEQLRHTERLSSFGVLAAEIAHELGTPLNVVDGRAKMILAEAQNTNEVDHCAEIIKNQAERMTAIIRQLLDFTRRPEQRISCENMTLVIRQVFLLLYPIAKKQHISFELNREEGAETTLNADFSQLQQVMVNLLMNAIQAMVDGGKVVVTLSNTFLPKTSGENRVKQKYLKISIQDEGAGICEADLDSIFTPFFTTKTVGTGTGLGLSIAHGIVEEHGGWIEVTRNTPKGACFTIFLPTEAQLP